MARRFLCSSKCCVSIAGSMRRRQQRASGGGGGGGGGAFVSATVYLTRRAGCATGPANDAACSARKNARLRHVDSKCAHSRAASNGS